MKETLVKYLAGLMDSDGSLSFQFTRYDKAKDDVFFLQLRLSLASSEAIDRGGFIDTLPAHTGLGGVHRYGKSNEYKAWVVNNRSHLEMLLPRLIKHMVVKGKHWQWLLDKWREQRGSASVTPAMREELSAASKMSRIENAGPIKPKNHPTWAWLAGYLDGDGWYRFKYHAEPQNYWAISVGAVAHGNDAAVLNFLQKAFGGVIRDQGQHPNLYVWWRNLGAKDRSFALRFLPNLAKHSRLKRHKIDQIISHHQQRLSVPRVSKRNYCNIDSCGKPAVGHKMCRLHYVRWYRHGDPRHVSDSLNA